ncbi:MAG TPA: sigma-70 family RNA polymerase sigma factor [Acidobacteriaceae bacterium]|jgi:RNA polymerase sigma-70 factor (ECF subfamily)
MSEHDLLAAQFEKNRSHLRAVAYRMLGSLTEADDAVQEAWLKLSRSDAESVENLNGWLTTVVARVCLDMLRARQSRREDPLEERIEAAPVTPAASTRTLDPEQETLLAESVGLALLVVLDTLAPAERISFVLHDLFAVPFDEIAVIVGRSPAAARQLASRARRRVQGVDPASSAELATQRKVVDAFLAALRAGDFDALVAVLDPNVVITADKVAQPVEAMREIRGAENCAKGAIAFARGARAAQPALIDGTVGLVVAPRGRLFRALRFTFAQGKTAAVEVIGDPARLRQLDLGLLAS